MNKGLRANAASSEADASPLATGAPVVGGQPEGVTTDVGPATSDARICGTADDAAACGCLCYIIHNYYLKKKNLDEDSKK